MACCAALVRTVSWRSATPAGVLTALLNQKIDILICDSKLPPQGGLGVTQAIRRNSADENRTLPILIMTSDTQQVTIKQARDAGASMVVAKPMSPTTLYDRMVWIAFDRRQFIDCPTYFGPDRRFKIEGYPTGVGRRASRQGDRGRRRDRTQSRPRRY